MSATGWKIAALCAGLLLGGHAAAQVESYRLDDAGRWSAAQAEPLSEDQQLIARARRALADNEPAAARAMLTEWIDQNARSSKPELPEAYRLRGDALVALDAEHQALYDYELVIRRFPESPEYVVALERELDIALQYANGRRKKFWGMRIEFAGDLAVEMLVRVQERLPGSVLAERAAIELGDYYYRRREMALASEAYDLYLLNFPNGPNRMKAMQRRIYASISRFAGPEHDASGLIDAKEQIRLFAAQYPAEAERQGLDRALIARLDESAAAQMLDTAGWYMKRGDAPSARLTLKRLLARYPETTAAATAERAMIGEGWADPEPASPSPADEAAPIDRDPLPATDDRSEPGDKPATEPAPGAGG